MEQPGQNSQKYEYLRFSGQVSLRGNVTILLEGGSSAACCGSRYQSWLCNSTDRELYRLIEQD